MSRSAPVEVRRFDPIAKVRNMAGKAVCQIQTATEQATGALYQVADTEGNHRFLIITCNQVLPTNASDEILKAKFLFQDIQQMVNITLKKADVKFFWTEALLYATVIEISQELLDRFYSY